MIVKGIRNVDAATSDRMEELKDEFSMSTQTEVLEWRMRGFLKELYLHGVSNMRKDVKKILGMLDKGTNLSLKTFHNLDEEIAEDFSSYSKLMRCKKQSEFLQYLVHGDERANVD